MSPVAVAQEGPFALPQAEKRARLLGELAGLDRHHRAACPEYGRIARALWGEGAPASLEALPYLPVGIFKRRELRSIPPDRVFKTLVSSGTTGAGLSRIVLDEETAARQTRALTAIMASLLGPRRLPMLIIDSAATLKDRQTFSARGAGILGMSNFGRDHLYALDAGMRPDVQAIRAWLGRHQGEPILAFGFTFMVWQYLHKALEGQGIDLSDATLVHSGGWKRLQAEAVDNAAYKAALRASLGIRRVHSFYGMVEQVGSVFLECEAGLLHAPSFAEAVVRDGRSWEPLPPGRDGVVQVLSSLPLSYPGHSLLTEDEGRIVHDDGCPCGRRGRAFLVHGRLPLAELRGCSDTHAYQEAAPEAAA